MRWKEKKREAKDGLHWWTLSSCAFHVHPAQCDVLTSAVVVIFEKRPERDCRLGHVTKDQSALSCNAIFLICCIQNRVRLRAGRSRERYPKRRAVHVRGCCSRVSRQTSLANANQPGSGRQGTQKDSQSVPQQVRATVQLGKDSPARRTARRGREEASEAKGGNTGARNEQSRRDNQYVGASTHISIRYAHVSSADARFSASRSPCLQPRQQHGTLHPLKPTSNISPKS